MANNTTNNDIDPRLERMLKEGLANRAKKIEAMKQWQQADQHKDTNKSKLKIFYGAVSGMAAMLAMGFFLMHNGGLYGGGMDADITSEPIFRGALVDPSIYDAIDAGETAQAIHMIDSSCQICNSQLLELDRIEVTPENKEELHDTRLQINQELDELRKLEKSLRK